MSFMSIFWFSTWHIKLYYVKPASHKYKNTIWRLGEACPSRNCVYQGWRLTKCIGGVDGTVADRICKEAEITAYFKNLQHLDTPPPNDNCNSSSWGLACEAGWNAAITPNTVVNSSVIPIRVTGPMPCCPGFFCPRGLSCMIRKYIPGRSSTWRALALF